MRISDQEYNRLSVLKRLRAAEPVSRTDLAALVGLTGGTITGIVGDLIKRGLVIEEKVPARSAGRPRINLRINRNGAFAAAAMLTEDGKILVQLVDLKGERVHSERFEAARTASLWNLAEQFYDAISQAISSGPVDFDKISQVGIGLPAIVNAKTGTVEFFETFNDAPCPFADIVGKNLGIPTRIDNNNNHIARAEHWFGEGTGLNDFTVVLVELGLGAARYQSGELLLGSRGIEAELGHVKVVPENGRACHCGATGCLQTYCSLSGIVNQYAEITGTDTLPYRKLRGRFAEISAMAISGDEQSMAIFKKAGSYLGTAIANHINMQDPEMVIILSREPELFNQISDSFFETLHRNTLPVLRDPSKVTFKQLDDQGYSRGAAAMVLEQLYQAP